MSWDIHGEPLQRGHCEVHPWVHEPYPCGACIQDGQRFEEEHQAEADYWRAQEDEFYAEMEIAELVAGDLGPFALAGTTA